MITKGLLDIWPIMPVPILIVWHIVGEKPYRCCFDGCDRAFAQMANLHHHMRNHEDHVKKAANKQYQCSICSRAYTNESSLKNHTIKVRNRGLSRTLSLSLSLSITTPSWFDHGRLSLSVSLPLSKTIPSRIDLQKYLGNPNKWKQFNVMYQYWYWMEILCLLENPLLLKENMSSCLLVHTIGSFVSFSLFLKSLSLSIPQTNT